MEKGNQKQRGRRRQWKFTSGLLAGLLAFALMLGLVPGGSVYAAPGDTAVADNATLNTGLNPDESSTDEVGKIWTDKTVSTGEVTLRGEGENGTVDKASDADFLVGLSAVSSTSNLTTSTDKPLDIVLVLDKSGSMKESFGKAQSYYPTYSIEEMNGYINQSYYALIGGTYVRITEEVDEGLFGWKTHKNWRLNGEIVYPMTSPEDTQSDHVQFYVQGNNSRRDAMKYAVDNFIISTARANQSMPDESKHRISIVTFSSNAETNKNLTEVTGNNAAELIGTVNSIGANGATDAGDGMSYASTVLTNQARPNAQKVVIFFTDGVPTKSSDFSESVANNAVTSAGTMKQKDTLIYSVGIFAGADPSQISLPSYGREDDTDRANVFMNAVSSNYPDATAWNTLGQPGLKSGYYKAASDSASLNQVFEDIASDITTPGSSPTKVEGDASKSGYITFTDQLGDYMEVTGNEITVVYAGEHYTGTIQSNGTVEFQDTSLSGNGVYTEEANLSDLIVNITKGTGNAGDTVTVQIPATLIPLHMYEVKNGAIQKVTAASPIRVFYNVKLSESARDALDDPESTLVQSAVDENASFYSNAWTSGNGTTTAVFTPAENNQYYSEAGTDSSDKVESTTATANTVYTASWEKGEEVTYQLGNNGKLTVPISAGALEVKKTVQADAGLTAPDATFTFQLTLTDSSDKDLTGTFKAVKKDSSGNRIGSIFDIQDGGTFELKNGESIYIYGLPAGTKYSVQETEIPAGFSVQGTNANPVSGSITVGAVEKKTFTNVYSASGTFETLTGTKTITNRDFTEGDTFTFKVEGTRIGGTGNVTVPMPSNVSNGTITIEPESGESSAIEFGTITFKAPGIYTYRISEQDVDSSIPGVSKDTTVYTVTYTVTDNGNGTLNVSAPVYTVEGAGTGATPPEALVWNNTYTASDITIGENTSDGIKVQKTLTGRDWITSGNDIDSFTFKLEAKTQNAPMPSQAQITVTAPEGTKEGTPVYEWFGDITYKKSDLDGAMEKAFVYEVSEQGTDSNGLTYDKHAVTVTVTVKDDGKGKLSASVIYDNSEGSGSDQSVDNAAAFTNTYAASNATYRDLTVTKNLTGGRADQLEAGEFDFAVTLKSGDSNGITFAASASNAVDGTVSLGTITFTKAGSYTLQITEVIPDDAVNPNVGSGNTSYKDATPEQKAQSGWTKNNIVYDNHTVEVTFNVTDNKKGQLTVAEPTIYGEITFTNEYQASGTLDGSANLTVTKNLAGREWDEGDSFTFSLAGHGQTTQAAIANGTVVLPSSTTVVINSTTPNHQAAFGNITFKAPGNYEFSITESSGDIDGLAYDTAAKSVKVSVKDTGDGVLKAEVTDGANPTITNTYTWGVLDGSANLKVSKTLSGRDWVQGDRFTFTLAGGNDETKAAIGSGTVIMPGSTEVVITNETTDHTKAFENIIFKEAGTYTFVITEEPSGRPGITDDTDKERTVTVTVTQQQDETLTAEVAAGSESLAFTNEYSATGALDGAANLKVTKVLTGRPWNETDEFTFTLSAADDTTTAAVEAGTVVLPGNAGGLTISAEDAEDGSYTKAFENITFNKRGNYKFVIAEEIPDGITPDENGAYKHDGIQYDTRQITVDVLVEDDNKGTLTATAKLSEPLTFTNVYSTSDAEVNINGTKTLNVLNGSGTDIDGKFTFEITGVDEDGKPAPLPDETQVRNDGNSIPFGTIKYTMENVFGDSDTEEAVDNTEDTEENLPEDPSADTGADDEETLPDAGEAPEEGNNPPSADTPSEDNTEENGTETDGAPGTDDSTAPGTDDSTTPGSDDSTTSGTDGSGSLPENVDEDSAGNNTSEPEEEPGTVEEPADVDASDNAESETVPNSALELLVSTGNGQDPENEGDGVTDGSTAERSKTFTYTVTELAQDENNPIPGVTNDTNPTRTFTVTVTDDGKGNLTAVCSETGTTKFNFVNTYEADPEESSPTADGGLVLTKVLNGRDLKEGEFTFRMTGISDNAKDMSLEARNNADGTVSFGSLTFTDDGEYRFAITETNNQLGGVAYDATSYFAVANVTDNTDGTLSVAWTFKAADGTEISEAVFTNSYKAAAANVTLKAEKLLDGRTINAGEFAFELKDESGTVLYRVVNAADGTVQFPQMTFENAGTYKYTISEQKGSLEGITYDQTVYNVVITVTDDGNGQLNAAVNTEGKDVVFRNVYKAPSSDNGGGSSSGGSGSSSSSGSSVQVSSAQTGDDTNIVLPIVGICASVAVIGICVAVVYSRRKKTE